MKPLIYREDHERIKKEWEEEEKKMKALYKTDKKGEISIEDCDMEDESKQKSNLV